MFCDFYSQNYSHAGRDTLCYTYLCIKVLHRLVKHEKGHKDPWKKYVFHPFPVEIKRWICSYCTWPWKFPLDSINKPTCSVHYTFMPKVKASHIRRGKKITRDFKEKQPGDFVSRAVEFSGIKLQFRGRHRRERPLLDASHTSPQADLQAVDTAEQNEKWFLWKVSCHHPLSLSLLAPVTLHTPANLIHSK